MYIKILIFLLGLERKIRILRDYCGGVKPRPMIWAQEQRFINNTPEEKKSQRTVVTNGGTRKYPRRLVREEYPPRK